jgi:hypothetical protein
MQCYFLQDGHVTDVVEMLPLGLSDEDAIAKAHTLSAKRKGPDSFQIWGGGRVAHLPRPSQEPSGVVSLARYELAFASRRMTSL